jgi:homoserine dehydrogenase
MQRVNVGIVGLGNVGMGTIAVLTENASQIREKLGFDLKIKAVCSRSVSAKELPAALKGVHRTADWREVVTNPDIDIVAELVGGTAVAKDIIETAVKQRKSIVTANKELMALAGAELWDQAIKAGINLAMAFRFMLCCARGFRAIGSQRCWAY